MIDTDIARPVSRARVLTTKIAAGVLGSLLAAVGILTLVFVFIDDLTHVIHNIGGVGFIAVGAGGLLAQLKKPEDKLGALQQVWAFALGLTGASLLAGETDALLLIPLAVAVLVTAFHPVRNQVARLRMERPLLAVLAAVAAVPLVGFALDQSSLQAAGLPGDVHAEFFHWGSMAAVALAAVLTAAVASLGTSNWGGPAWTVSGVVGLLGAGSIAFPDMPSSWGIGWGLAAVLWAVLFVIAFRRQKAQDSG